MHRLYMPIVVYCKYCGAILVRFRKIVSLHEVLRRTLTITNCKCPYCDHMLKEVDGGFIEYGLVKRSRRIRRRLSKLSH